MRRVFAVLLLLAACGPLAPSSPPPASQAPAPHSPPSAANADALALQRTLAAGAWIESTQGHISSARFGAPNSDVQFSIACNTSTHALTLTSDHEGAPAQATTLRLITSTQTLELPARRSSPCSARPATASPSTPAARSRSSRGATSSAAPSSRAANAACRGPLSIRPDAPRNHLKPVTKEKHRSKRRPLSLAFLNGGKPCKR